MRRPLAAALTCALLGALPACVDGLGPATPMPPASYSQFVTEVQPVLADRCAAPSCHGDASRPLEVFAPRRHRLDPAATFLALPLTDDELWHNYLGACAFLVDVIDPAGCELLTKALSPSFGGAEHEGGVIFADPSDRGYDALRRWVVGALAEERP